jgi:multicomponent Na+:H+ antiporter subunit D
VSELLVVAALVPLAGACVAFVLGPAGGRAVGLVTAALTVALSAALVVAVAAEGPLSLELGGWAPPLGITLRADGLSAAMIAMTGIVGAGATVHAAAWFAPEDRPWRPREAFWPLWLALWAGLNALFVSGDLFNIYVTLELVTVAAVALVLLGGGPEAVAPALRYLLAALAASLAFLLGVALLYAANGALDIVILGDRVEEGALTAVAGALMIAGLAVKGALFPLHFWLPGAHGTAEPPASALLSSLVVTASWYLVLRLAVDVLAPGLTLGAGQVIGGLGAAAILFGSVLAWRQQSLKQLIAYSTVAQVGYLFVALPLVLDGSEQAGAGATYHAVSHALAKAAMFLAAGGVVAAYGHDRIRDLRGLAVRTPALTFAFGAAGVTLMGLPPSGGFNAKFLMAESAMATGHPGWAIVLVLGGPLAAGYVFLVLRTAMGRPEDDSRVHVPPMLSLTALTLALLSLVLGFGASAPLDLINRGAPFEMGD